jgi:hypothetical protein
VNKVIGEIWGVKRELPPVDGDCPICSRDSCEEHLPAEPEVHVQTTGTTNSTSNTLDVITKTRLEVEDLPSFMDRLKDSPPPVWKVAGLIPDEGICLWHGQPRDFKSLCAQETALALAAGRSPFQASRFAVERPARVAYFTNEDSERLFNARMRWLTTAHGGEIPSGFFPFIRRGITFDRKDHRDAILLSIAECRAEVVFFDPGRSFSKFFDQGPSDFYTVAEFLRQIQNETAATAEVLVHHDKKPGPRGDASESSRSQQASGGGIFSISDCPVSFRKVDWNRCGAFPEDYKLSGDPKPFEVEFQSDSWVDDNGANRFGTWVRPVATTKDERDVGTEVARDKVLAFLRETRKKATEESKAWVCTEDVTVGAGIRGDKTSRVLEELLTGKQVDFATKEAANHLGRSSNAKLWSAKPRE